VILETLAERGLIVAQEYVAGETPGDTRILMLEGKVLRHNGKVAAVRRVPTTADFRSNVHVGATPTAPGVDEPLYDALDSYLGPQLVAEGHFLVGADVIAGKAIEVNVFSPGGLGDMNRFAGTTFEVPILDALELRGQKTRC
jgi:glutathione synthase